MQSDVAFAAAGGERVDHAIGAQTQLFGEHRRIRGQRKEKRDPCTCTTTQATVLIHASRDLRFTCQHARASATHTHTCTRAHVHARTHERTHARTHARTRARTHTRTHAHTHSHERELYEHTSAYKCKHTCVWHARDMLDAQTHRSCRGARGCTLAMDCLLVLSLLLMYSMAKPPSKFLAHELVVIC